MTRKEILDKLLIIFKDSLKRDDIDEIKEDASLSIDLGLDSINVLKFVILIEEKMSIDFDDVGFKSFKSVKDVVDYIENYINRNNK